MWRQGTATRRPARSATPSLSIVVFSIRVTRSTSSATLCHRPLHQQVHLLRCFTPSATPSANSAVRVVALAAASVVRVFRLCEGLAISKGLVWPGAPGSRLPGRRPLQPYRPIRPRLPTSVLPPAGGLSGPVVHPLFSRTPEAFLAPSPSVLVTSFRRRRLPLFAEVGGEPLCACTPPVRCLVGELILP